MGMIFRAEKRHPSVNIVANSPFSTERNSHCLLAIWYQSPARLLQLFPAVIFRRALACMTTTLEPSEQPGLMSGSSELQPPGSVKNDLTTAQPIGIIVPLSTEPDYDGQKWLSAPA